MKKSAKILAIISAIILIIGIICFIGTESIVDNSNAITAFFSIFGLIIIRVLIVFITLGSIILMWLIYGIVLFVKKLKTDEKKWKDIVAIIILSLPILAFIVVIISLVLNNN